MKTLVAALAFASMLAGCTSTYKIQSDDIVLENERARFVIGADGKAISAKTMELPPDAIPSVVRCLANIISSILPKALGQHLPLIIGILSVPLALAFDTDSYFYGMLPVMIGIGQAFGVNALPIAVAMVVCRNCATFISPMVPATLLGTGLAEVEIKDHIKASFLYVWGFSILCMLFAALWGIMPL